MQKIQEVRGETWDFKKNLLSPWTQLSLFPNMGECSLGFATRGATAETPKKWGCKWKHQGLILGSGAEGLMPGKGLWEKASFTEVLTWGKWLISSVRVPSPQSNKHESGAGIRETRIQTLALPLVIMRHETSCSSSLNGSNNNNNTCFTRLLWELFVECLWES